jgi:uncharacterized membrane protein YphA (DoxX/SURF4 family)
MMREIEAATPAGSVPRRQVWPKRVSTICRFVLAGVWLWAGLAKAADPSMAVIAVRAYEIVPEMFVKPVAWGLPFIEIGLAVLLALGIATRIAAALSLALILAFIAGAGSAWARGLQIGCGCFGGGGADPLATWRSYGLEIARDAAFAAMAAWLIAWSESFFALGRRLLWPNHTRETPD